MPFAPNKFGSLGRSAGKRSKPVGFERRLGSGPCRHRRSGYGLLLAITVLTAAAPRTAEISGVFQTAVVSGFAGLQQVRLKADTTDK